MKKLLTILLLTIATVVMGQYTNLQSNFGGYPSAIFVPKTFDASKTYPLVLFFHGNGESGGGTSNLTRIYNNGLPKVMKAGFIPPFECIIICPQDNYGGVQFEKVPAILTAIQSAYKVDTTRIFITGLSAGGATTMGATMNISKDYLKKFAAIVAFSPAATYTNNAAWFKENKVPIWLLGGTQTADAGYASLSTNTANAINAQVPNLAKLSIKAGIGHGGSFTSLYDTTFVDGVSFWTYLKDKVKIGAPTIAPLPIPTPIPSPIQTVVGLTYAQAVKIADSVSTTKLITTKVNSPLATDVTGLVIKKATDIQDGYISKELVNKLLSLEMEISLLKEKVATLQAEVQKTNELRRLIKELLNTFQ